MDIWLLLAHVSTFVIGQDFLRIITNPLWFGLALFNLAKKQTFVSATV